MRNGDPWSEPADVELQVMQVTTNAWSSAAIVVGVTVAWLAIGPIGRLVFTLAAWTFAWTLVALLTIAVLLLGGSVLARTTALRNAQLADRHEAKVQRARTVAIMAMIGWVLLVTTLMPPWWY